MDLEPYKTFWSSLFKPPTCRRLGAQPSLRWPCRRLLLSSTSWEKAELSTVPFWGGGHALARPFQNRRRQARAPGRNLEVCPLPGQPWSSEVPVAPLQASEPQGAGFRIPSAQAPGAAPEHKGHTLTGQASGDRALASSEFPGYLRHRLEHVL